MSQLDAIHYENMENGSSSPTKESQFFADIQISKSLSKSRYPVFSCRSATLDQDLAIKVFKKARGEINPAFLEEARFKSLAHENIISILATKEEHTLIYKNKTFTTCCILMEKALCDFFHILNAQLLIEDEKLARTYFHHLIQGIEYLHSRGISHMDLKPENLLFSSDYILKIGDFDLAHKESDKGYKSKGTPNFRAPEIINNNCLAPKLTDIYSAGILLFAFVLGHLPYDESELVDGFDLQTLLYHNPEEFWKVHKRLNDSIRISRSFQDLFVSMTKENPAERTSLEMIKNNEWYRGPVYSNIDLKAILKVKY